MDMDLYKVTVICSKCGRMAPFTLPDGSNIWGFLGLASSLFLLRGNCMGCPRTGPGLENREAAGPLRFGAHT